MLRSGRRRGGRQPRMCAADFFTPPVATVLPPPDTAEPAPSDSSMPGRFPSLPADHSSLPPPPDHVSVLQDKGDFFGGHTFVHRAAAPYSHVPSAKVPAQFTPGVSTDQLRSASPPLLSHTRVLRPSVFELFSGIRLDYDTSSEHSPVPFSP